MGFFSKGVKVEKADDSKIANQQKMDAKMLDQILKMHDYSVTLDHFSGLDDVDKSAKVKVEVNSFDQCLKIKYSSSVMQIPYADIIDSTLTNDVEIPQDDFKTKYLFYIHIRCRVAGNEKELVFSNLQDKTVHLRDIIGLNHILSHRNVKIEENERKEQEYREGKSAEIEHEIAIQQKHNAEMLNQILKMPEYGVTLDHFSGLDGVEKSAKVKVEANSFDQFLKIKYSSSEMQIPYADVIDSALSTDVEIPQGDFKTKYLFYIHIRCLVAGNEKELVFSNLQDNTVHLRDIIGLNHILSHLNVKIEENERHQQKIADWDAKFDARDAKLKAQREQLLNKRAGMINDLHTMISGSATSSPVSPAPATSVPAAPAPSADPAMELRKFKSMLEEGLITQEDFDTKKKQLLGL